MYRQGLGDCFLIGIGTAVETDPRYILIDCGVHFRQDDGPKRVDEVLQNLVVATGGTIHVVVATHEHADHLSGFIQKGSPFLDDRLKVGQFWVSWTEKVGDDQADLLREKRGAARQAIERAVEKLRHSNAS
jgi:glyoxylase-like metal-dependent hydrolase (beta-lactamase superfamily II)